MNKRKIVLLALSLCMVAILAVGGTLAYFTDTDAETNVFTVGNVEIDLYENFDPTDAKLFPTTGKDENGNTINAITKEVFVTNTGSEDAYVRVHIAIPTILDDGDPTFDASKNVLHFNYDEDNVGKDLWDWSNSTGAPYVGNWNFYTVKIKDGDKTIDYNVYVVTYETALKQNESTVDAMHQVYLDSKVTNEDITRIKKTLGDNWKILVVAEGAQAEGFANAYDALNEAFGVPGTYTVSDWELPGDNSIDTVPGNAVSAD